MEKFNLVKSLTRVINNTSSPSWGKSVRGFILCLSLAVFGVNDAWGAYRTTVNVNSSPTTGGYVYIGTSSGCGESSCSGTSKKEVQGKDGFKTSGSFTWYFCHKTNTNYVFKGWTTNQNANSGDGASSNPWVKSLDATISASSLTGGNTYNYYAIFARMTADILSKDFGNVNVGQSSSTTTITVTHAHASKITAALSGTNASDFSLSKTTIVDNSVSESTATFTVTFKPTCNGTRQATLTLSSTNGLNNVTISLSGTGVLNDQSLSWDNESAIELNMLNGTTQNISASASSKLAVSYSSNNPDVLSVDDTGKLTAKSVGEARITASQGGDCTYSAATSISKTFNVKTKDTPIFTPNWSSTNLKVGDKVTLGVQYVSDGLNGNFKAAYNSTIFNVTREGNTITIEALNEGNASVTFTQTETDAIFAASQTYSFTVSKIANTLAADATHSMKVDETWNGVISDKNSDGEITTTTSDATIAYYDVASNTIVAQNTNNQSFNSKEVTITISQEATYKYTVVSKTIKVTVNKHVPTFTWSNTALYHNQTYNDFFTTNCSNALTVKSSSDDNVAYLVDGSNAQKLNLKTLTKAASTTLTVTQAENYYWAKHTETKTVTPIVAPNHVPFTYNEAMFNDPNVTTQKVSGTGMSWRGYVRLGGDGTSITSAEGYDFEDKYVVIRFEGIPDKVSFEYSESASKATSEKWSIEESSDGSNWSNVWETSNDDNGTSWTAVGAQQLSKNTRYLRLKYHGNFAGEFKNVTVTELKTFSFNKTELDFGSNKKDIVCASQTLTFNYANVGHKVTLSTNDPHFSVSPASITNIGGDKQGSQTITVSYSTAEVHTASNAKLTIKDELGNSKEVTLTGNTTKKAQTISWEKPYDIEEPAIPIGKKITGAATASSKLGVIYESSDPLVIEIVDDGKAFKAIAEGSATITAKQVGTEDWEETSISKIFKGTNKIIQVISWNQNFTRLLTDYGSQSLTAVVNLEDAQTGEQTYDKERSKLITYSSQNTSVVSVSGSTLTIVGKGETILTATVPGDDLYESATVTIPVKVREPSAGCEDVLLGNNFGSDEYEFFHISLTEDMEKVVTIDRTTSAIPGVLSFQHKGKKWGLSYSGEIAVYESTNNGSNWTRLGAVTPSEGTYNTQTYPLSRNATHIKFFRGKSAKGYHYIKNVEISPAQFIESNASDNKIEFGVISVNSVDTKDFSLNYANVKDNLSVNKTSSDITVSCGEVIDLDCGATGTTPITITFSPKVVGDFSDDIQFLDKNSGKNYTLKITAKVEKSTQHITWNPSKTEYRTIDQIELNATTSSKNPVQYYVKEGKDVADFVEGVLTIKKDGQVTICAHEPGDALWAAAVEVDKTFTIRKTDLHFDPLPTAATIIYPQALSESALTDGVVKDEDGNVVAGTIAWANPATQLNAGENQSQGITFTPAANPAWYNALSSSVSVTVQKAQPNAHAQAGDIIYGAEVQTSTLTNEGTEGTWSWTDEKKDQVLNVGTYEGLQVHFTPTDQTNYNEIDGTVSLTVTKAQPTITWTGATAFEWGEINNYFVASNGGEVVMSSLDESIATIQDNKIIPVKAGTVAIQGDMAESDNYQSATLTQTITINVPSENKFTNAAGDNDWNNPTNWSAGLVPEKTEEVDIVVSGELNIKEEVVVGSLTIEDGGSVNVLQGGDLTIQSASGEADAFGDLYVKNGGDVTLNGTLNVHDFVIESSIGTADGSSKSGQITNADKLTFNEGDAYIDIHLDPSGTADDSQWYGFTVPFEVDIATGVYRQENDGSFKQLKDKTNFDIMQYNPAKRLTTGKGWEYYHGILHPGEFYYLAIDGTNNVYRFRKKAGAGFTTEAQVELHTNGDATNPNANWNPVGNPCLRYTTTDYNGFVQVYKNGQSAYLTIPASEVTYVVGCPFFVQAQEGSLVLETSDATEGQFYAPRRMAVDKTKNQIQLLNQGKVEDQIFIMASEDATSDYEAGSDLLKAGVSKLCGQMWINAYGQQLSVQDAPLQDETALYNLSLYAPKAGEYMLHVGSQTNYSEIYLTLNGIIIWNLSQSDYPISLFKGTTNEYGLVFKCTQQTMPTTIDASTKMKGVDKFIHHEQMYILHNGQLYNAMGATVK